MTIKSDVKDMSDLIKSQERIDMYGDFPYTNYNLTIGAILGHKVGDYVIRYQDNDILNIFLSKHSRYKFIEIPNLYGLPNQNSILKIINNFSLHLPGFDFDLMLEHGVYMIDNKITGETLMLPQEAFPYEIKKNGSLKKKSKSKKKKLYVDDIYLLENIILNGLDPKGYSFKNKDIKLEKRFGGREDVYVYRIYYQNRVILMTHKLNMLNVNNPLKFKILFDGISFVNFFLSNIQGYPYHIEYAHDGIYMVNNLTKEKEKFEHGREINIYKVGTEDIEEWRPTEMLPEDYYAF